MHVEEFKETDKGLLKSVVGTMGSNKGKRVEWEQKTSSSALSHIEILEVEQARSSSAYSSSRAAPIVQKRDTAMKIIKKVQIKAGL